jgi:DNA replication protein DnaC
LGNVHYKLGDLADAERQYRHALSIYRRCKGEEHADTVAAKTTIEHLRYWMRERDQRRQMERRQTGNSSRHGESVMETDDFNDERSC